MTASDLILPPPSEGSREIAARDIQAAHYVALGLSGVLTNAQVSGPVLEDVARADPSGMKQFKDAADAMQLSARGYYRVLRVAHAGRSRRHKQSRPCPSDRGAVLPLIGRRRAPRGLKHAVDPEPSVF